MDGIVVSYKCKCSGNHPVLSSFLIIADILYLICPADVSIGPMLQPVVYSHPLNHSIGNKEGPI